MKVKLIVVIVISTLLLAGGIVECIYINSTTNELVNKIDDIIADDPMDRDKIAETTDWIEKKHKSMEFIIPHFELNQLTVDMKEAVAAVERDDEDTAYFIFARMREYAKRLNDIYRFRYQNIV